MSSIRSASSRTRYSIWSSLRVRPPEMIEEPARCGDDDIDAAAKRVFLRAVTHAAVHRRTGHRRVHRQVLQVFQNLSGQLASRREHERARPAPRLGNQTVKNRQQERRGLAAAGLRGRKDIGARERRRDRVLLDRRGPDEAHFPNGAEQAGVKTKRGEGHA